MSRHGVRPCTDLYAAMISYAIGVDRQDTDLGQIGGAVGCGCRW